MQSRNNPQTWRLFEFDRLPLPCPNCGEVHTYLSEPISPGTCRPLLLPPGTPNPACRGQAVDLALTDPVNPSATVDILAYSHVAARVREDAIRCERCGERFEDLEIYRQHPCEVHYR